MLSLELNVSRELYQSDGPEMRYWTKRADEMRCDAMPIIILGVQSQTSSGLRGGHDEDRQTARHHQ